jgi:hypothetical protein
VSASIREQVNLLWGVEREATFSIRFMSGLKLQLAWNRDRKGELAVQEAAVNVVLEILAVMLAAVTMALALAHALELPGKLRLTNEQYLTVQTIYYPGFTLAGIAELGSILATVALLILTGKGPRPRHETQCG